MLPCLLFGVFDLIKSIPWLSVSLQARNHEKIRDVKKMSADRNIHTTKINFALLFYFCGQFERKNVIREV